MSATYLVTGGTGFIGRFLVPKLLDRGAKVILVTRPQSMAKVDQLRADWQVGEDQLSAVPGDLTQPKLGLSAKTITALKKAKVDHFVHLAAIYDLEADAESQHAANIEGTRAALAAAKAVGAGCFHHVSSIAAAGLYQGTFTEEMFDEATGLDDPYYLTKHESEGLVRAEKDIPWRIYRPGIVVGHSETGEMDKVDGPYYFFPAIKRISNTLPKWLGSLTLRGGRINIVPVDYVATAMDHLMHVDGVDGRTFFLTDPKGISLGDVMRVLLTVAHGPRLKVVKAGPLDGLMRQLPIAKLTSLPGVDTVLSASLKRYGIPPAVLKFVGYPTRFDSTKTREILDPAGIECPTFESYAHVIWRYWDENLAGATAKSPGWVDIMKEVMGKKVGKAKIEQAVSGKVVVVTGATSGIGETCALKLAAAGATVILAARTPEKLDATLKRIKAAGGTAHAYSCDISVMEDCDRFVAKVLKDHDHVDILINNAGRSIRRSVKYSFDRFHDFERTMQLNYFGALRLIFGFAPSMLERKSGHIVNISSIGVLASPPRFSAYVASKAALDAFSWCAASEFAGSNVRFTTINMPLVKTPMIAPTKLYDAFPTLTPDQAGELVMKAIVDKPKRVATGMGVAGAMAQAMTPQMTEYVLNQAYHLFPDSAAARGLTPEQAAAEGAKGPASATDLARKLFTQIFSGVHW